ncbi:hypothetical protein SAMN05443667_10729 [Flavobacterium gillisiae]|uniref:Uncharacterized protein n=1 Tax=Flavobacterium gillisiae TaxID=150146 RepID=A0A1H4D390_9FLAO|nr:hypothetical protein SAMN05443667_10729 [Flavobacterium gillisiae]
MGAKIRTMLGDTAHCSQYVTVSKFMQYIVKHHDRIIFKDE